MVVGLGLAGYPLRRLGWQVIVWLVVLVALTVLLQSLGLAPAARS